MQKGGKKSNCLQWLLFMPDKKKRKKQNAYPMNVKCVHVVISYSCLAMKLQCQTESAYIVDVTGTEK